MKRVLSELEGSILILEIAVWQIRCTYWKLCQAFSRLSWAFISRWGMQFTIQQTPSANEAVILTVCPVMITVFK